MKERTFKIPPAPAPAPAPAPTLHRGFIWVLFLLCLFGTASLRNDVSQLRAENAVLKEPLRAGAESLKKQVAALELKVDSNAAFASEETSQNLEKIEINVAGIDSNAASITANAASIGSNAGLVQSNTKGVTSNAEMIQANAKGIANVSVAILQVLGSDVEAAVALEVPIVVARSLGNITAALEQVQKLVAQKMSSAELVFERVNFSFPASAKPDKDNQPPLKQCEHVAAHTPEGHASPCCLIGGPPTRASPNHQNHAKVPCGDAEALYPPCPSFCNATITCPMGSVPISTECAGYRDTDTTSPRFSYVVFQSNVTQLANGLHQVACTYPNALYMVNIAELGHQHEHQDDDSMGGHDDDDFGLPVAFERRMTTFCVSLKTSTNNFKQ